MLLLACGLLLVARAHAHGGGELVVRLAPAGPYSVSVWVNPPQPRVDAPVHFTVGVASQADGTPMLDAVVDVELRGVDDATAVYTAPATTDQSVNKLFYETDMDITAPGIYAATARVEGPDGGGDVTFTVDVGEGGSPNWLALGLAGLAIVLGIGLWRSARQRELARGKGATAVAPRSRSAD